MRIATLALIILACGASSAAGQPRPAVATATAFEVTPYAGYLLGGSLYDGPLGSSIGPAPAPLLGAQLGMRLAPGVAVVANIATGSSDVRAGIPVLGGLSLASSRVVLYDAGLQLDLPMTTVSGSAFAPFVQAGLGGLRQEITQSFVTITSTSLAANVGVGADVSVGGGFGIRVMAKDYIGRFDAREATSLDVDTDQKHHFAFSAGMRVSF